MADTTATSSATTPWGIVVCMSLTMFVLIASEFMPVALLTPIAGELGITEGQAGQAIAFSGFLAVITSLFGNGLLARFDRRNVMLLYTLVLMGSGVAVTFAPDYLVFMFGRALIGISIGGYISLTTAILARIVPGPNLPKALAMLQGGSALQVALIQFAITFGAFSGGLLYDHAGWWSPAVFSGLAFVGAAAIGVAATKSMPPADHPPL